jgi:hypothetical protein
MSLTDDLRCLAARKAKADALPPEIRDQYADTYATVRFNIARVMMELIEQEIVGAEAAEKNVQRRQAAADLSRALVDGDGESFLVALERLRAAREDICSQMGFTDYQGATPWDDCKS